MSTRTKLLGPLAARNQTTIPAVVERPETDDPVKVIAIDSFVSESIERNLTGRPPMGFTENLSPMFLSTGNPCLDFFFHVVPDTPPDDLIQRLRLAWAHDPLTALMLVCNLRGVRGTGKSDKEGFYTASLWLHKTHPKTLALNTKAFADFGYLKDLTEILFRLLEGAEVRKLAKEEWRNRKRRKLKIQSVNDKETARALRKERELEKAKRALERYETDLNYRFLYDSVSDVFADMLKSDMKFLSSGEVHRISLASKWCPSIDSSYDKCTLIFEGIARRVFPRESNPEYDKLEEAHYVYRIRDRLRKEVLVPLHKALELPEVYMSANQWGVLPYNRVASVAIKNYKELFSKHDRDRFSEYLKNVKSGKAKIAAGALLPHEIIKSLKDGDGGEVAELQWRRMVKDVAKKGKLSNCIAVCDVSGSMNGVPMEVSVALGLLVSELSEEPWKGKVITFSENPEIHVIEGDTLLSKTEFVRRMEWGMNTDFQKVFDRILGIAVEGKLNEDQLIKRVFVFSDMEFDEACRIETTESEGDESEDGDMKLKESGSEEMESEEEGEHKDVESKKGESKEVESEKGGVKEVESEKGESKEMELEKGGSDEMESEEESERKDGESKKGDNQMDSQKGEGNELESKKGENNKMKSEKGENKDMESKEGENEEREFEKDESKEMELEKGKNDGKLRRGWETDYEVIQRKIREKGYNKVPEIVFWNLRNSSSTPVVGKQTGVALLSGFSKNLLTLFLDEGGIVNPEDVMALAISGPEYKKLVVYD